MGAAQGVPMRLEKRAPAPATSAIMQGSIEATAERTHSAFVLAAGILQM